MGKPMDRIEGERCFKNVYHVLSSVGVPFFLIQGTALGAWRDNGFTPTERDIDIGFLQEEFEPYSEALANMFIQYGFQVRKVSKPFSKCRALKLNRNGIHVDLVAYILWRDKRFCCSNLKEYSIVHDRKLFETYQLVSLFDCMCRVPCPVSQYLELEYGPGWRIPVEDHVSKTRVYGYRRREGIPNDLLDT